MAPQDLAQDIFERYSVTYSSAARFFPKAIRHDVALLYAFVRLADEYVDNPEADPLLQLQAFREGFEKAWKENSMEVSDTASAVTVSFVSLAKRLGFEKAWVDAFFASMEEDVSPTRYQTWEDLIRYVYGSAEVIGLMMNRVMRVSPQYDMHARALGASMQLINFLRDVHEDHLRGRLYIPLDELRAHGLEEHDLFSGGKLLEKQSLVAAYIHKVDFYQSTANAGLDHLPVHCRRPVKFAALAYLHTLRKIRRQPLLVFSGVPKNTWKDITWVLLRNFLFMHETPRPL